MAEGDGDFGYDERDPLLRNTDDKDGDDAAAGSNVTTEFEPRASSTPAPNGNQRQTTMNRPRERPSFVDLPEVPGSFASTTFTAESELGKEFPFADKSKLKYKMDDKGRLEVGLIEQGKPYYHLLIEIRGEKGEYQINKDITKEIKYALRKGRRETLEEEIKKLTDGIKDNKKVAEDSSVSQTERNKARERAKRQIDNRTALARELDRLKKRIYQPSETIALEEFQKNDEVRQEREQEMQRERETEEEIMNDENRPSAERERAKETLKELEQEQNEIENEREREIEQLPLRERLREKVKSIFKKYGFTVTAVLLAVGTTLGVILSSLSNGLKQVANGNRKRL